MGQKQNNQPAMAVPLLTTADWYMKEPQFKIGFLNNNPPVYDLIRKVKGAIERLQQDREEHIPRPQ
jgi:arylsulfatase